MFAFHLHDQERLELMFSVGSKQGRGSPVSGFCWVFLIRLNVSVSPFFQYLCDVLIFCCRFVCFLLSHFGQAKSAVSQYEELQQLFFKCRELII
jgi:hypothetical protein